MFNSVIIVHLIMFLCAISSSMHSHLSFKIVLFSSVLCYILIIYASHSRLRYTEGNFHFYAFTFISVFKFPIETKLTQIMSYSKYTDLHKVLSHALSYSNMKLEASFFSFFDLVVFEYRYT